MVVVCVGVIFGGMFARRGRRRRGVVRRREYVV